MGPGRVAQPCDGPQCAHRAFIEPNASNLAANDLVRLVDDELLALRERLGDDTYPRSAKAYLDEWADGDHGWLRKFYPPGSDQPHEIDAKIARVEVGHVDVLDSAARRDRYQQFARAARELLADFRQVEETSATSTVSSATRWSPLAPRTPTRVLG